MATGNEMNVGNVSDFAFDKKGNWLAWIIDAQDKMGNGIELRNMSTGAVVSLDSSKASYKDLTWTEKGDGLATVRGVEDKAWDEKLYTLVAFRASANAPSGMERSCSIPPTDPRFRKACRSAPTVTRCG